MVERRGGVRRKKLQIASENIAPNTRFAGKHADQIEARRCKHCRAIVARFSKPLAGFAVD